MPESSSTVGIVNFQILPLEVLELAGELAINFHDALLPRDAGVHASTWALLNGAESHGVTCHVMTAGPTGVTFSSQRVVPIEHGDTRYSLNVVKVCIEHRRHRVRHE